jgi:hypothetical protein
MASTGDGFDLMASTSDGVDLLVNRFGFDRRDGTSS